jgi:hypothetical protein
MFHDFTPFAVVLLFSPPPAAERKNRFFLADRNIARN